MCGDSRGDVTTRWRDEPPLTLSVDMGLPGGEAWLTADGLAARLAEVIMVGPLIVVQGGGTFAGQVAASGCNISPATLLHAHLARKIPGGYHGLPVSKASNTSSFRALETPGI